MSGHLVPLKGYLGIFLALMALTAVTVYVAFLDLGPMNTVAAMTIAAVKAVLVVLYFMHVRWSSRLVWIFAAAGVFWLMIMIGLTMADYGTRDWL